MVILAVDSFVRTRSHAEYQMYITDNVNANVYHK